MPPRSSGHRAGLTRDAVLGAARDQLADGGLTSVTMRALAQRLDVAPNALYSHVRDKTELLDGLLDETLAAVWTPDDVAGDPVGAVRRLMTSTYEVLLAHPDLVPLYLVRQGARGPHARHLGEVVVGLLAAAGVHGPAADEALQVLIIHAIGFAAFSTRADDGFGPGRSTTTRTRFDRGLDWLLAGVLTATGAAR